MKKHLIPLVVILLAIATIVPGQVRAEWVIDRNGHVNYYQSGDVLSDSTDDGGSHSGKGSSGGSSGSGSTAPTATPTSQVVETEEPHATTKTESKTTSPVSTRKPEVKTQEPAKKDDTSELGISEKDLQELDSLDAVTKNQDVDSSGIDNQHQIELEHVEGTLKIRGLDDSEKTHFNQLMVDDVLTLEDKAGHDQVKIATGSANSLVLFKSDTGARTTLPVSVDLSTNVLSVTTVEGNKTVTMLPDQVVAKLQKGGLLDRVEGENGAVLGSKDLQGVSTIFSLEEDENGRVVYKLHGVKDEKVLWLFPVSIDADYTVAAANGAVIKTEKSFWNKVIDKIAF